MSEISSKLLANRPKLWLPYTVTTIGILASVLLWYCLMEKNPQFLIDTLSNSLPWVILVLGITLSIVFGIAIHLGNISKLRSKSLDKMSKEFKHEMIEHMHSEETKQKLENALLQGQKLQAMGTLAGGIAHDFNNILYAIKGYVEMAREDVEKNSLLYNNLGKVLDASLRGQELIARILTFSRRQRQSLKPIHLQATLENVLALLRPTIPASVSLAFHMDENDCLILGDQTQLHQVIVNIINNAVDAMDGEGTITIKIERIPPNDEILKQMTNKDNNNKYVRIDIMDTGHGMDQYTLGRIFDPFFTTKEVGKGTGLGLSTVHAIIAEHRGEIHVESELGRGTTFTLILPEYEENDHGKDFIG